MKLNEPQYAEFLFRLFRSSRAFPQPLAEIDLDYLNKKIKQYEAFNTEEGKMYLALYSTYAEKGLLPRLNTLLPKVAAQFSTPPTPDEIQLMEDEYKSAIAIQFIQSIDTNQDSLSQFIPNIKFLCDLKDQGYSFDTKLGKCCGREVLVYKDSDSLGHYNIRDGFGTYLPGDKLWTSLHKMLYGTKYQTISIAQAGKVIFKALAHDLEFTKKFNEEVPNANRDTESAHITLNAYKNLGKKQVGESYCKLLKSQILQAFIYANYCNVNVDVKLTDEGMCSLGGKTGIEFEKVEKTPTINITISGLKNFTADDWAKVNNEFNKAMPEYINRYDKETGPFVSYNKFFRGARDQNKGVILSNEEFKNYRANPTPTPSH